MDLYVLEVEGIRVVDVLDVGGREEFRYCLDFRFSI